MTKLSLFRNGALVAASLAALTLPAHADRGLDTYRGGYSGVVLHADAGFRGETIEVAGAIPDLAAYRFNDRASSVLVTRGTWLACEHANYRGRCEVISRGSGDLRPIGLNDNISSIRRYDGRAAARNSHDRDWRRH